jgi:YD repeat-containing protein
MEDSTGITTYAYSARSELVGKTDPGSLVQDYVYDAVSNRTVLVDPDGGRTSTVFDALNRSYSVTKPTGHAYTALYDANGRSTTLQLGLSSTRQYAYDAAVRLTSWSSVDPIWPLEPWGWLEMANVVAVGSSSLPEGGVQWLATGRAYVYALDNPTTFRDPTGLETCEEVQEDCLVTATRHQSLCQQKVANRYNFDRMACRGMRGAKYTLCISGATAKYLAGLTACRANNAWRFALCGAQYEDCVAGRDAAWKAKCYATAGLLTYCLYQVAKDTLGACTGNPEVVLVP